MFFFFNFYECIQMMLIFTVMVASLYQFCPDLDADVLRTLNLAFDSRLAVPTNQLTIYTC